MPPYAPKKIPKAEESNTLRNLLPPCLPVHLIQLPKIDSPRDSSYTSERKRSTAPLKHKHGSKRNLLDVYPHRRVLVVHPLRADDKSHNNVYADQRGQQYAPPRADDPSEEKATDVVRTSGASGDRVRLDFLQLGFVHCPERLECRQYRRQSSAAFHHFRGKQPRI